MINVAQHLAFINEQITFHEKRVAEFKGKDQEWRRKIHLETAAKFKALAADLALFEAQQNDNQKKPYGIGNPLSLSGDDIEGLPEELLKELSISDTDRTEFAIVNMIDDAGGILSLDKILIGLFKATGEIYKRQNLTNRLYRMAQKGMIFSVPSKKGAYSTTELTSEEVDELLKPNAKGGSP